VKSGNGEDKTGKNGRASDKIVMASVSVCVKANLANGMCAWCGWAEMASETCLNDQG